MQKWALRSLAKPRSSISLPFKLCGFYSVSFKTGNQSEGLSQRSLPSASTTETEALPWERSTPSRGCASQGGTAGWWYPGCAQQWLARVPHTQSSGWYTGGSWSGRWASWGWGQWLRASRTYHCAWHSDTLHWCCSRWKAWCWSGADKSQQTLEGEKVDRSRAGTMSRATRTWLDGGLGLHPTACARTGTPLLTILEHCTHTKICWSNPIFNAPGKFDNENNIFINWIIIP